MTIQHNWMHNAFFCLDKGLLWNWPHHPLCPYFLSERAPSLFFPKNIFRIFKLKDDDLSAEGNQQHLANNAVRDYSKQQHFILTQIKPPQKIKIPRDSSKQCSQEHVSAQASIQHSILLPGSMDLRGALFCNHEVKALEQVAKHISYSAKDTI